MYTPNCQPRPGGLRDSYDIELLKTNDCNYHANKRSF